MSDSRLMLHCGAREVTRDELDRIEPPPATKSWVPIKHSVVLDTVGTAMADAGFHPRSVRIGVARNSQRLFATIDTATNLNGGTVTLAVAVVNSTDKSLPMKYVAGSRVFICDNLSLRSDLMAPVRRKHSRFGLTRFKEALAQAVARLNQFKTHETARIKRFHETEITDREAESVLLRCFLRSVLSHRQLRIAHKEWTTPSFEEFRPRTLWSLENALTTTLGPLARSNPQRFTATSLALSGLLAEVAGEPDGETV